MASHEIYQVWNPRNKLWVKMKNGKVLENSSFQFDDIPVFHKGKNGTPENNEDDTPAKTSTNNDPQDPKDGDDEDDEIYMGMF